MEDAWLCRTRMVPDFRFLFPLTPQTLTRVQSPIHHKSVGLTGGQASLSVIVLIWKQTEIFGELSGAQ
jgi:hypothetical protein